MEVNNALDALKTLQSMQKWISKSQWELTKKCNELIRLALVSGTNGESK